jgi:hypothetical protein
MSLETDIDNLAHEIKRKAGLLSLASHDDFPRICSEIRELLDSVERLAASDSPETV